MNKILIISDVHAEEHINGVGTWLKHTKKELEKLNFTVTVLDSSYFDITLPIPSYPEIRLVITSTKKIKSIIDKINPDHIHIATEGSLGLLTRTVCIKNKWNFTSSYHTRFPEYIFIRTKFSFLKNITYSYLRWFHNRATNTIVTTDTLKQELLNKGFKNVDTVPLGVDTVLFTKNKTAKLLDSLQKPVFTYFGRIATEKNIESFLKCNLPGSKLIIGDGPQKKELEKKYIKNVMFVGYKRDIDLVNLLSISDVCVFPSKTDTFGLTIIEALSCGVPVAAYNVQGPNNILTNSVDGYIDGELEENAIKCLSLDKEKCILTAEKYSWKHCTESFVTKLTLR